MVDEGYRRQGNCKCPPTGEAEKRGVVLRRSKLGTRAYTVKILTGSAVRIP